MSFPTKGFCLFLTLALVLQGQWFVHSPASGDGRHT